MRLLLLILLLSTLGCAIKVPVSGGATIKYQLDIDNLVAYFTRACAVELPDATPAELQHCVDVYLVDFLKLLDQEGGVPQ